MAHHILVLATFFGWWSPATWLFSVAVAIGGAIWAWLYDRTDSLLVPWLGHSLVDAAIFAIGYDLARTLFV
jgi:membrane protease YdiL (CAAX protease family)